MANLEDDTAVIVGVAKERVRLMAKGRDVDVGAYCLTLKAERLFV